MVVRQTLVSVYIQRKPALRPRLHDHLFSHLRPRRENFLVILLFLNTSLMRPPRFYDQDFIAQRWSHQRGSTEFFNFSFPHYRTKNEKNMRQLDYGK